jgi:hypothetical protein
LSNYITIRAPNHWTKGLCERFAHEVSEGLNGDEEKGFILVAVPLGLDPDSYEAIREAIAGVLGEYGVA